jgi:hypothetical protein
MPYEWLVELPTRSTPSVYYRQNLDVFVLSYMTPRIHSFSYKGSSAAVDTGSQIGTALTDRPAVLNALTGPTPNSQQRIGPAGADDMPADVAIEMCRWNGRLAWLDSGNESGFRCGGMHAAALRRSILAGTLNLFDHEYLHKTFFATSPSPSCSRSAVTIDSPAKGLPVASGVSFVPTFAWTTRRENLIVSVTGRIRCLGPRWRCRTD